MNSQPGWQDFGIFVCKPGQSLWLGQCYLAEKHIFPFNLLVHWEVGEKETWCLTTNLPDRQMTLSYYRKEIDHWPAFPDPVIFFSVTVNCQVAGYIFNDDNYG